MIVRFANSKLSDFLNIIKEKIGDTKFYTLINQLDSNDKMALMYIVESKDEPSVCHFLKDFPQVDINQANSKGRTALHLAASMLNHYMVFLLLDHGAKADCCDNSKNTILHILAGSEWEGAAQLICFETLKKNKAIIHFENNMGQTPLCLALEARNQNMVEVLITAWFTISNEFEQEQKTLYIPEELSENQNTSLYFLVMAALTNRNETLIERLIEVFSFERIHKILDSKKLQPALQKQFQEINQQIIEQRRFSLDVKASEELGLRVKKVLQKEAEIARKEERLQEQTQRLEQDKITFSGYQATQRAKLDEQNKQLERNTQLLKENAIKLKEGMEQLNEEKELLKKEKEQFDEEKVEHLNKVKVFSGKVQTMREGLQVLREPKNGAKNTLTGFKKENGELKEQLNAIQQQKIALEQQITSLQAQIQAIQSLKIDSARNGILKIPQTNSQDNPSSPFVSVQESSLLVNFILFLIDGLVRLFHFFKGSKNELTLDANQTPDANQIKSDSPYTLPTLQRKVCYNAHWKPQNITEVRTPTGCMPNWNSKPSFKSSRNDVESDIVSSNSQHGYRK